MQQLAIFGESESITLSPIDYVEARLDPHPDSPVVVGYGGGRNSTALCIIRMAYCREFRQANNN